MLIVWERDTTRNRMTVLGTAGFCLDLLWYPRLQGWARVVFLPCGPWRDISAKHGAWGCAVYSKMEFYSAASGALRFMLYLGYGFIRWPPQWKTWRNKTNNAIRLGLIALKGY